MGLRSGPNVVVASVLALAVGAATAVASVSVSGCSSDPAGGTSDGGADAPTTVDSGGPVANTDSGVLRETCVPLPAPTDASVTLGPADAPTLATKIADVPSGATIFLEDGTYPLGSGTIRLDKDDVTLRSKSGERGAVVLDFSGSGVDKDGVVITGSKVIVANLTIANAGGNGVHVDASAKDVNGFTLVDVALQDFGKNGVLAATDDAFAHKLEKGVVACSLVSQSEASRARAVAQCGFVGIDAQATYGFSVRDNRFEGIFCPSSGSSIGVRFWKGARASEIERNAFRDVQRGIVMGTGAATPGRVHSDVCKATNVGAYVGILRNNMISAQDPALLASASKFETGIALEKTCGVDVVHNTVVSGAVPSSSSIEVRYAGSEGNVLSNLMSHTLVPRDGAGDGVTVSANVERAAATTFVNAATGDLHVTKDAKDVIDKGAASGRALTDDDFDRQARDDKPDVGADEYYAP
ncbi:MAG: right-handed parallel beta-helix repeat-containing protein [Polyangiaceae bacterium]